MNLVSLFSRFLNRKSPTANTKSFASSWLRGRDDSANGLAMLSSAYQQSTWVYACVSTLAETVSAIPFRFVHSPSPLRGEGRGEVSSNLGPWNLELGALFDSPHPEIDRFQFWELVVSWLMLRGEAFILPLADLDTVASHRGPIKHLLVLNPDQFYEVIVGNQLSGWRYTAAGASGPIASQVLLPEEIVRIKLPHPFNFWRGLSPIAVAWLAAQTDYAASQFMKGVMLNNADTGLIVSTTDQLSPEQIEEVSAALRERKRSAGSADRPLFLWGGARVEKPTISTTDLQFLENRKFNRQELCAIFKVPQELLGYTEDANRSVSESARLNFMENRIAPLCKRLEAGIQPIIQRVARNSAPRTQDLGLTTQDWVHGEFHIKGTPIMQAAQRARVRTATELFNLGVPVDIISENLDLGLPALPHGRDSYLPTRLQKVGTLPPPKTPDPNPGSRRRNQADPGTVAACEAALRNLDHLKTGGVSEVKSPSPELLADNLRRFLSDLDKINDQLKPKDPGFQTNSE